MKNAAEERKICGELHVLHHLIRRGIDRQLDQTGAEKGSRIQGMIAGYLYDHSDTPIYQKDIEALLRIRRSTASGILACMERDGMLVRESDPRDGRMKRLILTEKAVAGMKSFNMALDNLDRIMVKGIPGQDVDIFLRVAERIRMNLEAGEEMEE